jgi:hypothetical protein
VLVGYRIITQFTLKVSHGPRGGLPKNPWPLSNPPKQRLLFCQYFQQLSIIAIKFNEHIQDTSSDTDTAFLEELSAKFDVLAM